MLIFLCIGCETGYCNVTKSMQDISVRQNWPKKNFMKIKIGTTQKKNFFDDCVEPNPDVRNLILNFCAAITFICQILQCIY